MRSLITAAMLASVFGPLAGPAFAADLDYPPPPPPYYEPHPVPPAFVPGPVPPVYFRGPRLYPRPILYPRPYPLYGRPVVRVYGEPRPFAEGRPFADHGIDRPFPREPRPYGEPGYGQGRDREAFGRERPGFEPGDEGRERGREPGYEGGRERGGLDRGGLDRGGYDHGGYEGGDRGERGDQRYGHYLSHDELDRRAGRERGERDHYADREPSRDFDR